MRIPIGALIAALIVVAAGSVVITTYFKQGAYVVNATGLAVGQSTNITLGFIPREIYVMSNVNATYDVHVYADAVFRAPGGALHDGYVVYRGVLANGTAVIDVVSARSAACRIVVVRVS